MATIAVCDSEKESRVSSQELPSVLVTELVWPVFCVKSALSSSAVGSGVQSSQLGKCSLWGQAHSTESALRGWGGGQKCFQTLSPPVLPEESFPFGLSIHTTVRYILFSPDLPICPWGYCLFRWFGTHLGFSVISSWVTSELENVFPKGKCQLVCLW